MKINIIILSIWYANDKFNLPILFYFIINMLQLSFPTDNAVGNYPILVVNVYFKMIWSIFRPFNQQMFLL